MAVFQLIRFCALVVSTAAMGLGTDSSFTAFITKYGRSYARGTKEYEQRRSLFENNLRDVESHNSKASRRWSAAVNHLSDRTQTELMQLRGLRVIRAAQKGRPAGVVRAHSAGQFLGQIKNAVLPDSKSWAHLNAVKAASDQSACGSCWALATATMLTANAEINGHNRTFSPQELVNCVPNPQKCGGDGGCKGSTTELAMNWVMEQGLPDAATVPYSGSDAACQHTSTSLLSQSGDGAGDSLEDMVAVGFHEAKSQDSLGLALGLQGWSRLPENEYEPLVRAVAESGPVAVSVAAGGWQAYSDGVFDACPKDAIIDHAVTLIGYGTDTQTGEKFWHIKNSWGPTWGESGTIRLLRHVGNSYCGTDSSPEVGTGCEGGPKSVHVCGMCGILYDSVVAKFGKLSGSA